ncbi:hypothetical protein BJ875DRAFT_525830 [Amylocarpus encephaloides]|uniref:Uncharacterized protein n=1 Tax=Amylocarpus encephaloides TaxID=45428 RepID=A0A9P7Y7R5_9HELO|nr:hypothetical protein BJ875DRAFT_525830 [Amylocarpus encephaloides]
MGIRIQTSESIRNVAYGLAIPQLILSSIALSGCTSSSAGIPNIFVAKYAGSSLRFSYMGICNDVPGNGTVCASTIGASAVALSVALSTSESLMQETKDLQKSAGILLPVISWITFALGMTLLVLLRRFGRINLIMIIRVIFWISSACSFTAAWAVTYTVAALSTATAGNPQTSIIEGSAIVGLQWATFACGLLVAFLVHVVTTDPKTAAKPVKKPVKQQGTTDAPPKAAQSSTTEPKQPAPKDASASKPAAPKEAAASK